MAVQISSDGTVIATGGADFIVKLWKREPLGSHNAWKVTDAHTRTHTQTQTQTHTHTHSQPHRESTLQPVVIVNPFMLQVLFKLVCPNCVFGLTVLALHLRHSDHGLTWCDVM